MFSAALSSTIDPPWSAMEPLRLGAVPADVPAADLYLAIAEDRRPLLRVDLYRETEACVFQDVIAWGERVFAGYGEKVYVVDPLKRTGFALSLGAGAAYFSAFYAGADYLLAASGESLLRLSPRGAVLWAASRLGLDGVVVHAVENNVVSGEGEWDPPGGWKPFALHLDSGREIQAATPS